MKRWPIILLGLVLFLFVTLARAQGFDHSHGAWNALLVKHVKTFANGNASAVDYAALKADQSALTAYLRALSAVSEAEYGKWNKAQRLAFLINSYNAFTVDLILTRYPNLESIKDLGSVFQSPWKKAFFTLLGDKRTLDDVEHGMIRAAGVFDDPRIHAGVVCASIGCPMLPPEAFVADRLDTQLEDGMRRFLADSSRNRFDPVAGRVQLSKIFDWYGKDFEKGHKGFDSVKSVVARYSDLLAPSAEARAKLKAGDFRIEFLDYDWRLNDAGRKR